MSEEARHHRALAHTYRCMHTGAQQESIQVLRKPAHTCTEMLHGVSPQANSFQAFKTQDSLGALEPVLQQPLPFPARLMRHRAHAEVTLTGFHWRSWGTTVVRNCPTKDSAGVGSENTETRHQVQEESRPHCAKGPGEPGPQPVSQPPHVHEGSHGGHTEYRCMAQRAECVPPRRA